MSANGLAPPDPVALRASVPPAYQRIVPAAKARLLSLLEYVRQVARVRTPTVSNLADHGRFLLHDHQVADFASVLRMGGDADGGDEVWFTVPRPRASGLPPEPDSPWLAPWLTVGSSMLAPPGLADALDGAALIAAGTHRDTVGQQTSLDDIARPAISPQSRVPLAAYEYRTEVERQFRHYTERVWRPWCDSEQHRRSLSRLYAQLFTLHQDLTGATTEEDLELVLGLGIGTWDDDTGRISYPLLSKLVDLTIHPVTGAAEIRPRDGDPRLELDAYTQRRNPGVAQAEQAARERFAAATHTFSPFDPESWRPALEAVRTCLDPRGEQHHAGFVPLDLGVAEPTAKFTVTEGWALFARPRSHDPLVQDLEKFVEAIARLPDDEALPRATAAMVHEPGSDAEKVTLPAFRGVSMAKSDGASDGPVRDLYFPKPFNDEQVRVVQLLEAHDGVVVQGPPGTGKTHTIANIICHWLATGRRVLVTSMKEPALAALRDKLPEEIRPLAISLLSAEKDGMRQFEQSVRVIANEVQGIDPEALAREVRRLEETIDALQTRIAKIDVDIGRWARLNLARLDVSGERIDPLDAAREVMAATGRFEWIPDNIGVGPQYTPKFSATDMDRLRAARRQIGRDIDYAGADLPSPDSLPTAEEIATAHRDLTRFARLSEAARSGDIPTLAPTGAAALDSLQALTAELTRVRELDAEIGRATHRWADRLREALSRGAHAEELSLLDALGREFDQAMGQRRAFVARPVALPAAAELDADFGHALQNLAEGRRAFGIASVFGKGEAKKHLESVRINGLLPSETDEWQHVAAYLALQRKWRELAARWNTLAKDLGLDAVDVQDASAGLAAAAQLAAVRRLQIFESTVRSLAVHASTLFPDWTGAQRRPDDAIAWNELDRTVEHYLASSRLGDVWAVRERLRHGLDGRNGRVVDQMRVFLDATLGDPQHGEPTVVAMWNALLLELARVRSLTPRLATVAQVTAAIEASGAPRFARLLRDTPADANDALVPDDWAAAWRLRRIASHLAMIDAQDEFRQLAQTRGELEHDLARTYHDAVVRRTWLMILKHATPDVCAALQGYLNAIERIATGAGRRAVRYRQEAREAAARAYPAVPCWIMSHARVSESLPAELGCFDLVVVDEASQSDLSALPALLRGRKLLIVGDDRQVAPESPGIEEDRIRSLMQRFLVDQVAVYRPQMSPDRSIYDLAKVVYARSGVLLREHFRCVTPIIEYSKREFYGDELRPLRVPTPAERFDPPLVDIHVSGARRDGEINDDEITCIVDEVRTLVEDSRTTGRSIGVVSLAGEAQAQRTWERLNEALGPAVLQRHQVACGDARSFQGRERDVIFLTLVATPEDPGPPQSRDAFAQRFNVAASRARDRMVLVRSVELTDLPEADRLRRGLIAHFADPMREPADATGDPRDRCESPLERALYDHLSTRGYRVTPQARVGSYRIDLVVEGEGDARLAVECDGDRHQGPETWLEDVRRQRVLERVGWTFWRCFAATLLRRPEAVLADLETALTAAGVRPGARSVQRTDPLTGRRRLTARR